MLNDWAGECACTDYKCALDGCTNRVLRKGYACEECNQAEDEADAI